MRFEWDKPWSLERHKLFPEKFKKTVLEIIKGSVKDDKCFFYHCPKDILHKILEMASMPKHIWKEAYSTRDQNSSEKDSFEPIILKIIEKNMVEAYYPVWSDANYV